MNVRIFIVDNEPAVAKVLETYLKELIDDFEVIFRGSDFVGPLGSCVGFRLGIGYSDVASVRNGLGRAAGGIRPSMACASTFTCRAYPRRARASGAAGRIFARC